VILVGTALIINYYGSRQTTVSHIENAAALMRDQLPLLQFYRKAKPKSAGVRVIDSLCVLSFIAFIVGCVLAYRALHSQS
jgi:hypothetical protein